MYLVCREHRYARYSAVVTHSPDRAWTGRPLQLLKFGGIALLYHGTCVWYDMYAARLSFRFPQSPPSWQLYADIVFTVLFALEMSLKLAALGLRMYFKDAWNWLDAIVVVEVGIYAGRPVVASPTYGACLVPVDSRT